MFKEYSMRSILFACLVLSLLGADMAAYAQRNMQRIEVNVGPKENRGALLQLPDDYSNTKQRYPLILFLHGKSKAGNDLSKLTLDGIPYLLHHGVKLNAVNPEDGKLYKFIILMPQAVSWGLKPAQVNAVLNDAIRRYRIDTSRIYITGYSAGGSTTVSALTENKALTRRFAAAVSLSPVLLDDKNMAQFKLVADANVPCWYFAGEQEPYFLRTVRRFIDSTNQYKEGLTKLTIGQHGHCCFKDIYTPSYKVGGVNIYEWMLQHKRKD